MSKDSAGLSAVLRWGQGGGGRGLGDVPSPRIHACRAPRTKPRKLGRPWPGPGKWEVGGLLSGGLPALCVTMPAHRPWRTETKEKSPAPYPPLHPVEYAIPWRSRHPLPNPAAQVRRAARMDPCTCSDICPIRPVDNLTPMGGLAKSVDSSDAIQWHSRHPLRSRLRRCKDLRAWIPARAPTSALYVLSIT
jgi:hypothetical protein